MGTDFTFDRVRLVATAYSRILKRSFHGQRPRILVNFDTRFLSDRFALETAKILHSNGIAAVLTDRDTPLAAVGLAVMKRRMQGAVIFTASFNEPIYNGIKLINHHGRPAMPSETTLLEIEIDRLAPSFSHQPRYIPDNFAEIVDLRDDYFAHLKEMVNFDLIRQADLSVMVDNLYGASRDYLDRILEENGVTVRSLHGFPYSSFGEVVPYCTARNLGELSREVVRQSAHVGLATDIDGDRFGIVDNHGAFLPADQVMPVLIEYLIRVRALGGGVVKSIATTDLVDRVCEAYQRPLWVTPVGFKHVAEMMSLRKAFLGVESTNGAALNHGPIIKDGILFSLLFTEMLAHYRTDFKTISADFYRRFPRLVQKEVSLKVTAGRLSRLGRLKDPGELERLGAGARKVLFTDGVKLFFDRAWLLLRLSGTHGVLRIYAEAASGREASRLVALGRSLLGR
jgi:phosphoglucomutase